MKLELPEVSDGLRLRWFLDTNYYGDYYPQRYGRLWCPESWLKSGALDRELKAHTYAEAVAEIGEEYKRWKEYAPRRIRERYRKENVHLSEDGLSRELSRAQWPQVARAQLLITGFPDIAL